MATRHSPRIDAVNNDHAVVNAARELAREVGLAELRGFAIAERAGVSPATVRRRFATKDDMMLAVYEDVRQELRERRTGWLMSRMPGTALEELITFLIETERDRRGFVEFLSNLTADTDLWRAELNSLGEELVERARKAEQIRADVEWEDLPFVITVMAGTPRWVMAMQAEEDQWRRLLAVFLDGLRAAHTRTLPAPAPFDSMLADDA